MKHHKARFQSIGVRPELHAWIKRLSVIFDKAMGDVLLMLLCQNIPETSLIRMYIRLISQHYIKDTGDYDIEALADNAFRMLTYPTPEKPRCPDRYIECAKAVVNELAHG